MTLVSTDQTNLDKPIYLFDNKMLWRTFKTIHDKFNRDTGPTPVHFDKILWKMLREKSIYIYLDETHDEDPIIIGLKLPEDRNILVLSNPTKAQL